MSKKGNGALQTNGCCERVGEPGILTRRLSNPAEHGLSRAFLKIGLVLQTH
jgi:hypothetical protein